MKQHAGAGHLDRTADLKDAVHIVVADLTIRVRHCNLAARVLPLNMTPGNGDRCMLDVIAGESTAALIAAPVFSISVTTPLRMPVLAAVPFPMTEIEPPSPPMWAIAQLTLEVPMSIAAIVVKRSSIVAPSPVGYLLSCTDHSGTSPSCDLNAASIQRAASVRTPSVMGPLGFRSARRLARRLVLRLHLAA